MPLKRIKQRLERSREQKDWLERLKLKAEAVRQVSDYLVLSPRPTGLNWRGVANATRGLFQQSILEIPHYYSNSLLTNQQNSDLIAFLIKLEFKQLIISGIHPYFLDFLQEYKEKSNRITGAIFHGALTELQEDPWRIKAFSQMVQMANEGAIDKIGFVKKGLAETLSVLTKASCYNLNLRCNLPSDLVIERKASTVPRIAIPGSNNFNKNLNNQVAASLLIKNSEVHVWGHSHDFEMWELNHRIVNHSHAGHSEFLTTLAGCDLALYLSFSESWGQIVTECLALGIPCLSSDNNAIFDDSPELREVLVVSHNDNPYLISKKIEEIIRIKDKLSPVLIEYSKLLDKRALEMKDDFLANNSTSHLASNR